MENINSHISLVRWKQKYCPKDKTVYMEGISGLPNETLYSAPPFFFLFWTSIYTSDVNWRGNPYEDEAELS